MHGKTSATSTKFNYPYLEDILGKFIAKQKIRDPVLMTHSASSVIGMNLSKNIKIKKLIMISPSGLSYFRSFYEFLFRMFFIQPPRSSIHQPSRSFNLMRSAFSNFSKNIFHKKFWKLLKENYNRDFSPLIRSVSTRTELIFAENDEMIPVRYARRFDRLMKNSDLHIVRGSHDLPILNPERLVKIFEKIQIQMNL